MYICIYIYIYIYIYVYIYIDNYPKNKKLCLSLINRFNSLVNVGLSPSKKVLFTCFNKSPLKMKKNAFYIVLKTLFVPKILKLLS